MAEQELNGFLSSHKVVSIERKLIDQGVNSFWAICVDYLSHPPGDGISKSNLSRSRVDYKAILPPEEFTVFSQLREMRKELAQSEAVPVYALFTNEQLAQMVQRRCRSKSDLAQIEGIGESKIDKYAERLLPLLLTLEARPRCVEQRICLIGFTSPRICGWLSTRRPAGDAVRPWCGSLQRTLDRHIAAMSAAIREGTFPVGRFQQFLIRDPKERVITAPCFDERVLHHAIMNVCEPVMDRWLIDDTFACRTGKGREAAIQRAQHFTRNAEWFLKLDVRKYFDSVPHASLMAFLERRFKDRRLLELLQSDHHGVSRRAGNRPADRQPDIAALRELLFGLAGSLREGVVAGSRVCALHGRHGAVARES